MGINNQHKSNGIKELTHVYKNCIISQILIYGKYVTVRESLLTRVIISVINILIYIDVSAILPMYEGSCHVYRPKWYHIELKFK
jgi:hypothetical protein